MSELVLCQRCSHLESEHKYRTFSCHCCDCPGFVPEPPVL